MSRSQRSSASSAAGCSGARGSRQVRPTAAGRVLLDHLDEISSSIERARSDVSALAQGRTTVRLGIYQSIARYLLPALVQALEANATAIELVLEEVADDGHLLRQVAVGELDLAFASLPLVPGPFAARELFHETYYLVVRAAGLLAQPGGADPMPLAALSDLPLIDYRGVRALHHTWTKLADAGRPPRVVFRSDDNGTIHALIAAGLGVAVLPQLSVDPRAEGVRVLPLDPGVPASTPRARMEPGPATVTSGGGDRRPRRTRSRPAVTARSKRAPLLGRTGSNRFFDIVCRRLRSGP